MVVVLLESAGAIKFDEPAPPPIMIDCNCTSSDTCPQGRIAQMGRCRIPAAKATVTEIGGLPIPHRRYPLP